MATPGWLCLRRFGVIEKLHMKFKYTPVLSSWSSNKIALQKDWPCFLWWEPIQWSPDEILEWMFFFLNSSKSVTWKLIPQTYNLWPWHPFVLHSFHVCICVLLGHTAKAPGIFPYMSSRCMNVPQLFLQAKTCCTRTATFYNPLIMYLYVVLWALVKTTTKWDFIFFLAMNLPIIFSINRLVCKISKRVTNGKLFLVIFQNPRWCLLFSSPNIKQRKAANPLIWSWNQKKLGMFSWKNIETIKWWSKQ